MNDDAPVVEAVLAMDDITVDVPDFEAPAPVDEEQDVIGEHEFMDASGPTLNETKAYVAEEEATLVPTDVRADAGTFEIPDHDPMEDIAEPVPMNIGGLHSPSVPQERDEDLTGHTEPLPELPDLDAIEEPDDVPSPAPQVAPSQDITPPELPDFDAVEEAAPVVQPAPPVQHPDRWMPWTAKDPGASLPHKRPLCPFSKRLEPGNSNVPLQIWTTLDPIFLTILTSIYHVGLLLKQLGRNEALETLLVRASAAQPDDGRVHAAVHHLR